jgi:hypothetical protein
MHAIGCQYRQLPVGEDVIEIECKLLSMTKAAVALFVPCSGARAELVVLGGEFSELASSAALVLVGGRGADRAG